MHPVAFGPFVGQAESPFPDSHSVGRLLFSTSQTPLFLGTVNMSVALESQSEQIRSRMASLRLHMHKDAQRIVANTNRLLDWKDYVRQFPKALVAAGVVTGFLLGPGRKVVPSVNLSQDSIDELLKQRQEKLQSEVAQRPSLASGAFSILTGLAMSGASILVRRGVENYFSRQAGSNPMGSNSVRGGS